MQKLTQQQTDFIKKLTVEYMVTYSALARLFDVTPRAIKHHALPGRKKPLKSKKRLPISASAVKHFWDRFKESGEINGVGVVFKPGDDKAWLSEGCRSWLEDNVGWHALRWMANRLKCPRGTIKYLLDQAELTDQAFRYSCRGVTKLVSEKRNFHIPKGKLEALCRGKILRWYWEGKQRNDRMIILPHDAEWIIENYEPDMVIPWHPGGSRYC